MRRGGTGFGLRQKIILTFLALGIVVSGALASASFAILSRSLFSQLQNRVLGLARVAAGTLDPGAVARLAGSLARLPAPQPAEAEASADFRAVSDRLNAVRGADEQLVRYIYLFVPGPDAATALFLVDADVLTRPDREVSHFGDTFDVSTFPVAVRALVEGVPLVEESYSFDEDFGVNSLSGYAPVPGLPDGLAAVVGVDMVDTDVRAVLRSATIFSILAIVGTVVLTVLASVVLGTVFTRGIVSLDGVVRRFGEQDFDVRAAVLSNDEVGRLGRSFNGMADSIQDYKRRQDALHRATARFVPNEFLKLLGDKSIESVQPGDQAAQTMAVLFADIRGFTSLAEKMSLEQVFRFLNSYLERMRPEITSMGGFIDKYIGDAIMALFPGRPDDAQAASVGMQRKVPEYNRHRANSGFDPIAIGIGVHIGPLMLGTVGDSHRMDGTVISDAVNLSSRLESLTRRYGAAILTSGETVRGLTAPARFRLRFVDRVKVYGRADTTLVFECLDGDPEEVRDRKLSYRSDLARALRFYYKAQFRDALEIILPLSREHGDDAVLHLFRQRCDRHIRKGVRPGWEVDVLSEK